MGMVYRAHDPVLHRDVALKVLKPQVPKGERRRFRREALYGARFCHPGFVRVFDYAQEEGREWFAMEYLPGQDMAVILRRAVARNKMIPLRLIADTFRQVLGALQYAHDCELVHRDVKPENMFVTRDPNTRFVTTKLLDLGVALDLATGEHEHGFVGDPRYMAPEQAKPGARVDSRADVYAAGMALCEVLTARHPWPDLVDADAWTLLAAHRERPAPRPSDGMGHAVPAEVKAAVDLVVARACAKDPDDRFNTAREMHAALFDALAIG